MVSSGDDDVDADGGAGGWGDDGERGRGEFSAGWAEERSAGQDHKGELALSALHLCYASAEMPSHDSGFRAAIQLQFDFHRAIYNLGTVLYGLAEDTLRTGGSGNPKDATPNELYSQSAIYIAAAHALKLNYNVADSWDFLDGWLDAIRLVYTLHARSKSDVLAGIVTG